MLNRFFNSSSIILIIFIFSQSVLGLVISEVMYDPTQSDTYNEWIELYNEENRSIDIAGVRVCDENLSEGYIDKNISNATDKRGYWIKPDSFFIVTDGGSGSLVKSNFNISNETFIFHTGSSSICGGLGNIGETIDISFGNETIFFDYTVYLGQENQAPYYDFNRSVYRKGCIDGGTPGYYLGCNGSEEISSGELSYDFNIDKETITLNDTLYFFGNITNPNHQTRANLTIKIGVKNDGDSYEYPDELILFDEEIILEEGVSDLKEIIGDLSWKPDKALLSGDYKAYSRLVTEFGEKRPSQIFFLYNKANIFLDGFSINDETIKNNETIILNFNISNDEEKGYTIQAGIEILNLKTINSGKYDYSYWCNETTIQTKENIAIFCSWKVPEDIISENQTYKIYSLLKFEYENKTIQKQGDSVNKIFMGEKDLGEPTIEILDNPDTGFGRFSNIIVRYNSNNYGLDLRFITYGYPKQVLSDYDFNGIKANDHSNPLSLNIVSQRGKEYILALPLFAKPDCDGQYEEGNYRIRVRAFKRTDGIYNELLTQDTEIQIQGKNENLCPKPSEKRSSPGNPSSVTATKEEGTQGFTYAEVRFDSISIPEVIDAKNFKVSMNATNKANISNDFTIESYLYSGSVRFSESNKQKILLNPGERIAIELKNQIIKDIDPLKEYRIMIKINSTDRKSVKSYSEETRLVVSQKNSNIRSFYTLQKKQGDTIKLYASSDDEEGIFELLSLSETITKRSGNKTSFEVRLLPGINNYFLLLKEDNETIDVKRLTIFANGSQIQVLDNLQAGIPVYTGILGQAEENKGILVNSNAIKPIIYNFGSEGRKRLINYLLITVSILGFSFYIRRRYF